jgi:hypothetical protein
VPVERHHVIRRLEAIGGRLGWGLLGRAVLVLALPNIGVLINDDRHLAEMFAPSRSEEEAGVETFTIQTVPRQVY